MSRLVLRGVNGANPLGFMGAMGLLRILDKRNPNARLGFLGDGSTHPFVEGIEEDVASVVAEDAARAAEERGWRLEYEKQEKRGVKLVADLKAPPAQFTAFLSSCVEAWCRGDDEAVLYAAAFGTSIAVDGKGNTKPTAFHFTAANQQFLDTVEKLRASVNAEWTKQSLFVGHAARPGSNLRWDPAAERNWALMANNPIAEGTSVDAPLEWLAFRSMPLFPCFPVEDRIITTGVHGRGDEMRLEWPLWSIPASLRTVRSLLQMSWGGSMRERASRGVFALCTSSIRRTNQGFGNFSPATVVS